MQVLADLILERHVAKGANEVPLQLVGRFDVFFDVLNVFAAQITSLRLCVGLGPTWSCSFGGWLWSGTRRWRLCPGSWDVIAVVSQFHVKVQVVLSQKV